MTCGFPGFPESDQHKSPVGCGTVLYAWPILQGKEEAWRRVMQEIRTMRQLEYAESRRRLVVRRECVHLAHIARARLAIISIDAEAPEQVFSKMAASELPFDRWFVTQVQELYGIDLAEVPSALIPQRILAWQAPAGGAEDHKES